MRHGILIAVLALAGCTPEVCEVENLPYQGTPTTPEELFALAQYAARNDCGSSLYSLLSQRTRDEHSELKIKLFWASQKIPEPWGYKLGDVVAKGQYAGVLPDLKGRKLMFVQYQEPGKPDLLAQLYVVEEKDEEGRVVPRLGLQEQVDSQEAPNPIDRIPVVQPPG